MALFGRRRVEQLAEKQQHATRLKALEAAQSDFTEKFRVWLEAVKEVQVDTGANALTDEILSRVGALPLPQDDGLLNRTQHVYLASFARSYCGSILEHQTDNAVVAESEAGNSGVNNLQRLRYAVGYWKSVEAYVAQALAS
jgi:hypothetical protein